MTVTPRMKDILDYLTEVADRDEVCPRNAVIAEAIGVKDAQNLPMWLGRLERDGWIDIERFGFERRVTIKSTGKATAMPANVSVVRESRHQTTHKDMMVERGVMIVSRDPCLRCGVRGDIGCEHQAPSIPVTLSEAGRVHA